MFRSELDTDMLSRNTIDANDIGVQQDLDLFVPEEVQNGLRDIGILARKLRPTADQCYPAS
jgi:hypothetical protein